MFISPFNYIYIIIQVKTAAAPQWNRVRYKYPRVGIDIFEDFLRFNVWRHFLYFFILNIRQITTVQKKKKKIPFTVFIDTKRQTASYVIRHLSTAAPIG